MGGTIDCKESDHLLIAPPFIIADNRVDELISKLDTTLTQVLKKTFQNYQCFLC